ncbi:alanine racemase [Pseudolysinimonas sp.]|uniref:alanine racemase n=1 Tax=Pseudolysinimonas sp. TaxID=2680009 RepID=UPI003F7FDDBC
MIPDLTSRPTDSPWIEPSEYWPSLTAATEDRSAPVGVIGVDALAANAHDLLDRAGGMPIRVASKSVRVRGVLDAVLALPGFRGVMAYTLAEALWLSETGDDRYDDILIGYPTADRAAIARLAADERAASRITLMVDDVAQLLLIDAVAPPGARAEIRVAIELDASYRTPLLGHIGVRRSPLHEPDQVLALAAEILRRPGFRLVGIMAYEAQIAGVVNRGKPVIQAMQAGSVRELAERRGAAVAAVRQIADLEFVNGGGTGSIESTRADGSVTEVAAGSGLLGPHLFDGYTAFTPAPAAAFALDVVRRPTDDIATLLGGGWIASGPSAADRSPKPVWPEGLRTLPREGAGEVQTPLQGDAARRLRIGDRVWLRHTKAGEISEHLDAFALVRDGAVVGELPTYRGERRTWL